MGAISSLSTETTILLVLSLILLSGFIITRVTKRLHLPNVSGFILAGILIGPRVLNLVPGEILDEMSFVSDFALALIAFSAGKCIGDGSTKGIGRNVIVITLLESLVAGLVVALSMYYLFRVDLDLSLLLGAAATATAPASTLMTIRQYRVKGSFVNMLLKIVALDDVVCLLAFSVITAVVSAHNAQTLSVSSILLPILYNLLAIGAGLLCGVLLSRLINPSRSMDNRLILVVAMLLGLSGGCALIDVSPLLACMAFSGCYLRRSGDQQLYKQLDGFAPPILSMFFIIAGMNLDISLLGTIGLFGVGYFIIRIIGKYIGAWLGCKLTHCDQRTSSLLGLALIPQAGVAIGLAYLGARILPAQQGSQLLALILASSVLYELIGPVCAKIALLNSGDAVENPNPPSAAPKTLGGVQHENQI